MSFNLNGMMQGIGAGLVNYGEILKEQDKQDWDEQQALLKYEREERMNRLKIAADKENTQLQVNAQVSTADKNRQVDYDKLSQQKTEFNETNALNKQKIENDTLATTSQVARNDAAIALDAAQAENAKATAAGTRQNTEQIAKLDSAIQTYAETMFPDSPERQVIFAYQMKNGKTSENKPLAPEIVTQAMKQAEAQAATIEENSTEWKQVKQKLATQKGSEPSPTEVRNAIVTSLTSISISQLEKDLGVSQGGGVLGGSGTSKSSASTPEKPKEFDLVKDRLVITEAFKSKDPKAIDEVKKIVMDSGSPEALDFLKQTAKSFNVSLDWTATPEEKKTKSQPEVLNPDDPLGNKPGVAAWRAASNKPADKTPIGQGGKADTNAAPGSMVLNVPAGATVVDSPEKQRSLAMSKLMYNGPYNKLSAAKKAEVDKEVAKMNRGK